MEQADRVALAGGSGTAWSEVDAERSLGSAQYALSCVGQPYRHLSALRLAWNLVTRWPIPVPDRGQQFCFSLVGRALERAGHRFADRPHEMMIGDLARHFGVAP